MARQSKRWRWGSRAEAAAVPANEPTIVITGNIINLGLTLLKLLSILVSLPMLIPTQNIKAQRIRNEEWLK